LLEDFAIRTVSSAYTMINNFIKISNLLSSSSEIELNPRTFSCKGVRVKVFNATFNNISVISW
jgi:hypothetical protein